MAAKHTACLVAFVLAAACSAGNKQGGTTSDAGPGDDAAPTSDASPTGTDNVTPMVVKAGPGGTASVDVAFISVTLCVPGTTTCQTIDDVSVDTGSSGLRVLASALPKGFSLPQANASTGSPLAECYQFADGFTWGSVRMADVKIAGEVAAKIPLQIIGDPGFTSVPSDCSASGPSENTVTTFGANGLIGINQIVADCGTFCANANSVQTAAYYSCSGATCAAVAVPVADQVPNPIARFETDKNGALLTLPSIPATGAPMVAGTLTFGIGTQANNGLGSAKVLTVDAVGNFTTTYKGATLDTSFLDSGTNTFAFNDSSIPQCANAMGFLCPSSTLDLTAQNIGRNGVTTTVMFSVANTETLFGNGADAAFDDLATTGIDNNTFDWGLPFFIGRSVYVAVEGAATPGGRGPYFAY
jgi:hypothetical protein